METSRSWNYRIIARRIAMGLVFAAFIGGVSLAPAMARDNRYVGPDNGHYNQRGPGYDHRKPRYDRNRYDNRRRGYEHGRPGYRPYGYRDRDYGPPVVYAPPPPPGIGIFFPPIFIHP